MNPTRFTGFPFQCLTSDSIGLLGILADKMELLVTYTEAPVVAESHSNPCTVKRACGMEIYRHSGNAPSKDEAKSVAATNVYAELR